MIDKMEKIGVDPLMAVKLGDEEFRKEEELKKLEAIWKKLPLWKRMLGTLLGQSPYKDGYTGDPEDGVLETVILEKPLSK